MKSFKFRLQSVMTVRRFRKMEAAGTLAEHSRTRQATASRLEDGRGQLRSLEEGLREAFAPRVRAAEVLMIQNALLEQRSAVAGLQARYMEALTRENKAREAVLKAQKDYEAMVKLEERQRELARKEEEKENEKAMQEFVAARHVLTRRS